MISLNTLIFSNTDIFKDKLYPILLFCSPLHFLLPVEPENEKIEKNETDIFTEQGLCQGHTPVPLAKDRDRFLHLVNDIQHRKDDYAAQLSSLTMAAMSKPAAHKNGEKRYQILSSLLSGQPLSSSPPDTDDLELWQARLVLSIAEILDREEEELQEHLQLLDDRELDMLRQLQGETKDDDENPFAQLEAIRANMLSGRPGEMKKRFNAWLKLMSCKPLPEILLWLATSQDSADQVINEYEKKTDGIAIPILKLLIPSRISISTPHLIDQINRFHEATIEIHQAITADLVMLAGTENYNPDDPDTLLPYGDDWVNKWQIILEEYFPESSHGRTNLTIYLLPNSPVAELFSLREIKSNNLKHGLLGIVDNV